MTNGRDPDVRIDVWLRSELDAVPEPSRAVSEAIDAAAFTPQRRGRLFWLRQLLGLERVSVQSGSAERPEVVLTPGTSDGAGSLVVGHGRAISTPLVMVVLLLALAVLSVSGWLALGPGRALLGGSDGSQPMRPIEDGPNRAIAVDPTEGHFATLAEAVAEAQPGDRIELHPGTYPAEVVIDKDIEIVGIGDRDAIVVEPLPLAAGEALTDRLRVLFHLQDSDAVLRGFTLRGSENGTAVVVDGGEPLLHDVRIAPDGSMVTGGPSQPRESLEIRSGSPMVQASHLSSLVHVDGGATPIFEDVIFEPGCMLIEGAGASPTLRDVDFIESDCPGFSISIAAGAHADIEAGNIASAPHNAGIRVANDDTTAHITGTGITGGAEGVLVGRGAAVTLQRSNVQTADVGIKVQDGELTVIAGALMDNGIGLQVSGDAFVEITSTDICNQTNFDLHDGATVPDDPVTQNQVCDDSETRLASTAGSR